MAFVPDKVEISVVEDENGIFTLRRVGGLWPAGVAAKAAEMDAVGLPIDATRQQVTDAGIKGRSTVLAATLRYRREQSERSL